MMKTTVLAVSIIAVGFSGAVYGQDLTLLGSYDIVWPATEVVVEGNYAYLPDADSGLVVLNVSDPGNPYLMGQGLPETRVEHISMFGNFIYGIRESYPFPPGSTRFKVIDVANPAAPFLLSSFTIVGHILDIEAIQGYVYALNDYGNGMNIIDVSDPYNPYLAGYVDVIGLVSRLHIVDGMVYIITLTHGLRIFDITYPTVPLERGHCNTPGMPYDLYVHGNYAYIADLSDLTIIDVSAPISPYVLQDNFQVFTRGGITANDVYVFVGVDLNPPSDEYFAAIDITIPFIPEMAGGYQMPSSIAIGKPIVRNNCVYLPQYNDPNKLLIFSASITGIEESTNEPGSAEMLRSYPNPFNDRCVIKYTIPIEANVEINVYNILGQKVENLHTGIKQPGIYSVGWNADDYPSGIYFARLQAPGMTRNLKMVLLK